MKLLRKLAIVWTIKMYRLLRILCSQFIKQKKKDTRREFLKWTRLACLVRRFEQRKVLFMWPLFVCIQWEVCCVLRHVKPRVGHVPFVEFHILAPWLHVLVYRCAYKPEVCRVEVLTDWILYIFLTVPYFGAVVACSSLQVRLQASWSVDWNSVNSLVSYVYWFDIVEILWHFR
jgi:hypothetical protein